MKLKTSIKANKKRVCTIPRKHEAIEALLVLAWRKSKNERPIWLINEINSYC